MKANKKRNKTTLNYTCNIIAQCINRGVQYLLNDLPRESYQKKETRLDFEFHNNTLLVET